MATRPLPPDQKARRRAKVAAWRARAKAGLALAKVTYNSEVTAMLVRLGWLTKEEVADPKLVDKAISDMLEDTAQKFWKPVSTIAPFRSDT